MDFLLLNLDIVPITILYGVLQVFQVMDEKKHLYAIKYVDLEEADQQTIESYQNEISHLNKLQQHSDKIIRLYD